MSIPVNISKHTEDYRLKKGVGWSCWFLVTRDVFVDRTRSTFMVCIQVQVLLVLLCNWMLIMLVRRRSLFGQYFSALAALFEGSSYLFVLLVSLPTWNIGLWWKHLHVSSFSSIHGVITLNQLLTWQHDKRSFTAYRWCYYFMISMAMATKDMFPFFSHGWCSCSGALYGIHSCFHKLMTMLVDLPIAMAARQDQVTIAASSSYRNTDNTATTQPYRS